MLFYIAGRTRVSTDSTFLPTRLSRCSSRNSQSLSKKRAHLASSEVDLEMLVSERRARRVK